MKQVSMGGRRGQVACTYRVGGLTVGGWWVIVISRSGMGNVEGAVRLASRGHVTVVTPALAPC